MKKSFPLLALFLFSLFALMIEMKLEQKDTQSVRTLKHVPDFAGSRRFFICKAPQHLAVADKTLPVTETGGKDKTLLMNFRI